ncbi:unnamed protein product [Ectocarpus sp. CCAP 1310/34]|nr:unnamed protein product [Ectocarpus sp. CCAP 1310/34]
MKRLWLRHHSKFLEKERKALAKTREGTRTAEQWAEKSETMEMIALETAVRLCESCKDVVNGGKGVSAEHQHRAERTRKKALENVKAKGKKSATGTVADVRGARGGLGKRKRKSQGEPLHAGLTSLGSDGVLGGSGGGEEEADSDDDDDVVIEGEDDGSCLAKEQPRRDDVGKAVASGNLGRQVRSARRSARSYESEDAGGEELVKTLAGYMVRKMAREEEKERAQGDLRLRHRPQLPPRR